MSGWGDERDAPGVMDYDPTLVYQTGDVDSEVDRLVQTHGSAIAGLRTGAKRHTDGKGRFTSRVPGKRRQVLSGPTGQVGGAR